MNLATAVGRIRRMRVLVVAALVVACVVGVSIPYRIPSLHPRRYEIGVASASALIDSAKSQVADLGVNTGSDVATLSERASLLATLMATPQIKDEIASSAGVAASQLIATPPAAAGAPASPAPAVQEASINPSSPQAKILSVSIPNLQAGLVPIVVVNTQAPTAALASRIANASVSALEAHVNSVATTDRVPDPQRLVVRPLGPATSAIRTRGPGVADGLLAAVGTFVLMCVAILCLSAPKRGRRGASELARAWPDLYAHEPLLSGAGRRDVLTEGGGAHYAEDVLPWSEVPLEAVSRAGTGADPDASAR